MPHPPLAVVKKNEDVPVGYVALALVLHSAIARHLADYDSKEVQELLVQWNLHQAFGQEVGLASKCTHIFSSATCIPCFHAVHSSICADGTVATFLT